MSWRPDGFSAKGVLAEPLSVVVENLPDTPERKVGAPNTPNIRTMKDSKKTPPPVCAVNESMSSDSEEESGSDVDRTDPTTEPAEAAEATEEASPSAKYFDAEEKTLHDMLLEQSQQLHAQGLYAEALRVVEEAEAVALEHVQNTTHAPSQRDRSGRGKAPNAECFRCGDQLHLELERLALTHFEWREEAAARARAAEAARRATRRSPSRSRGGRLQDLQAALAKMEGSAWDGGGEAGGEAGKVLARSMCNTCLSEVEADPRNAPLVRHIQAMRAKS